MTSDSVYVYRKKYPYAKLSDIFSGSGGGGGFGGFGRRGGTASKENVIAIKLFTWGLILD